MEITGGTAQVSFFYFLFTGMPMPTAPLWMCSCVVSRCWNSAHTGVSLCTRQLPKELLCSLKNTLSHLAVAFRLDC